MSTNAISESRLFTIHKRQDEDKWGRDYQPSIRATPQEAPRVSTASQIRWPRYGRDIHCLSSPETGAVLLALYHQELFDLQEQRMLSPTSRCHPLVGHPLALGSALRMLNGTVHVAERLGLLKWHPTVKLMLHDEPQGAVHVPFPWIGDLLLFMQDANGPYCVNWNVKARRGDHCKPFERRHRGRPSVRLIDHARARHSIEIAYYQDAGIRTHDIALEEIPTHLLRNLSCLYGSTTEEVVLSRTQVTDVEAQFAADMANELPPMETVRWLMQSQHLDPASIRAILYRAIWARRLRVDLMRPILMDKPLMPERTDVLVKFSHWFER